jgi:hypothetical protein
MGYEIIQCGFAGAFLFLLRRLGHQWKQGRICFVTLNWIKIAADCSSTWAVSSASSPPGSSRTPRLDELHAVPAQYRKTSVLVCVWSEVAPMKLTKSPCEHQGGKQCSNSQGNHMTRSPQIESTNPDNQSVSHGQVEHPPQDVHRRRRQAFSRGRSKRALERKTRDAVDQVRDRVGEESSAEEVGDKMIPVCYLLHQNLSEDGFPIIHRVLLMLNDFLRILRFLRMPSSRTP